jgi:hypothetical protein
MVRILRGPEVWGQDGRLRVSRTVFDDNFTLHDENDPFIPGTTIKRIRGVRLGSRAVGYVENEIDNIAEQLVALRDASPVKSNRKPTKRSRV